MPSSLTSPVFQSPPPRTHTLKTSAPPKHLHTPLSTNICYLVSCCFLYKRSLKLTRLESDLSTRDKFFSYQRGFSIRVLLVEVLLFASGSPKRAPYWPAFKLTKSVQRFSFFWNLKLSICSNSFFLKRKLVVGNCYRLCKGNYKCCRFFVGRECYLLCYLTPTFKSKEVKKLRSPFFSLGCYLYSISPIFLPQHCEHIK